ncbi:MAG: hypothetical protein CO090_07500 [Acidobacteria bacterium CG_4_9_14_3_um_filter_49_7]|nr:MAG: hypothetical protein CO090_07500 [Acidobacteria bacterium CG_4_9_14_3_um_filter_49_7]
MACWPLPASNSASESPHFRELGIGKKTGSSLLPVFLLNLPFNSASTCRALPRFFAPLFSISMPKMSYNPRGTENLSD